MTGLHPEKTIAGVPVAGAILHLMPPGGAPSLRVPVAIEGASGGVVTLEAKASAVNMSSQDLNSTEGTLYLPSGPSSDLTNIRGTVVWHHLPENGRGVIKLGLRLASENQMAKGTLENFVPSASADLKNFWEQWDLHKSGQATSQRQEKIHLVILIVAMGVLTLKFAAPKSFNFLSDSLLFLCGIVGAVKAFSMIRQKRTQN